MRSLAGILSSGAGCAALAAAMLLPSAAGAAGDGLGALAGPGTPLRKGDTIAFFGDSITMQGDGEKGYIGLLRAAVAGAEATRDLGIRLIGRGLNGGRVPTVLAGKSPWGDNGGTMEELLAKDSPDTAVILLGVNDVWHGEKGTSARDFEAGLRAMLDLIANARALPVLCTPPGIGEKPHGKNPLDGTLDEYCGIVRALAAARGVALCDLRRAFGERLARDNKEEKDRGILTYDGVHLSDAGNALVARALAETIAAALGAARAPAPVAVDPYAGLQPGLGTLPLLGRGRTRSISAENPTGEKGKGGMAVPNPAEPKPVASARAADDLGLGWKVRPFIRINAGETAVLMDVRGSGVIQHIWLVEGLNRGLVLRFFWDGEERPSVETPAPEFFAVGHGRFAQVNSLAVVVNPANALNCFWPMPFRTRARITLTNETAQDVPLVAYQITYVETEVPAAAGTFHAQYRRASTAEVNPCVILDGVKGRGRYAGTFLAWTQLEKGWFGEGEIKFYMDGDDRFPTICGTGTEDYFLGSYGFPRPYTTAYSGTVLPASDGAEPPSFWSLYRWHVQDPIDFERDLRVTIQALGWAPDGKYKKMSDDIASVAFWYQTEPHAPFPELPPLAERVREARRPPAKIAGAIECETMEIVDRSPGIEIEAQDLQSFQGGWSDGAHLFVRAKKAGDFVEIAIPAKDSGPRRILLHATRAQDYGTLRFLVNGTPAGASFDGYAEKPAPAGPIDLGVHEPKDGKLILKVEVTGANAASTGVRHFFGLDAAVLGEP